MTDNDKLITIPYVAYERLADNDDRKHNRLVIVLIVLTAAFLLSNIAWLLAYRAMHKEWLELWQQYDYISSEEYEVILDSDDGGNANYIGEDGTIYNGESDSQEAQD